MLCVLPALPTKSREETPDGFPSFSGLRHPGLFVPMRYQEPKCAGPWGPLGGGWSEMLWCQQSQAVPGRRRQAEESSQCQTHRRGAVSLTTELEETSVDIGKFNVVNKLSTFCFGRDYNEN